jgi:riboflavin kinase/FMN adenylyltransferase
MKRFYDLPEEPYPRDTVLTIGNFDGVHRGHQELIRLVVRRARELDADAAVLTFHPHPLSVLRPGFEVSRLNSQEERAELLASLGIDLLIMYPFTRETAQTSAKDFVTALKEKLRMKELWVGPDFALGRNREGNIDRLKELGAEIGFEVRVFPTYVWHGHAVHSTDIRQMVSAGKVEAASDLLGRPYRLSGQVVAGARRGKRIGFPTINVAPCPGHLMPATGVYAAWAVIGDGSRYPAVVNVGRRPTFDGDGIVVEAHLLDFAGNVYGWEVELWFHKRLRDEMKFPGVDALVEQIRKDVEAARSVLSAPPSDPKPPNPFFRELEHTADWQVLVYGRNYESMFANAAREMFMLIQAPFDRPTEVSRGVEVSAVDRESLLVKWLSELLYLQEVEEELYTGFCFDTLTDTKLVAAVQGVRGRSEMAHIKAVTYHDISIEGRESGGYQARVLFDT